MMNGMVCSVETSYNKLYKVRVIKIYSVWNWGWACHDDMFNGGDQVQGEGIGGGLMKMSNEEEEVHPCTCVWVRNLQDGKHIFAKVEFVIMSVKYVYTTLTEFKIVRLGTRVEHV